MHFGYILAALLPVTTWALPSATGNILQAPELLKRDAAIVLADLKTVNTRLSTLSTTLFSFENAEAPSAATLTKLQNQNRAVNKALKQSTKDTKASRAFTLAESKEIADFINKKYASTLIGVLDRWFDHFPGLEEAGASETVRGALVGQRRLVLAQGNAVVDKLKQRDTSGVIGSTNLALEAYDGVIERFSPA